MRASASAPLPHTSPAAAGSSSNLIIRIRTPIPTLAPAPRPPTCTSSSSPSPINTTFTCMAAPEPRFGQGGLPAPAPTTALAKVTATATPQRGCSAPPAGVQLCLLAPLPAAAGARRFRFPPPPQQQLQPTRRRRFVRCRSSCGRRSGTSGAWRHGLRRKLGPTRPERWRTSSRQQEQLKQQRPTSLTRLMGSSTKRMRWLRAAWVLLLLALSSPPLPARKRTTASLRASCAQPSRRGAATAMG